MPMKRAVVCGVLGAIELTIVLALTLASFGVDAHDVLFPGVAVTLEPDDLLLYAENNDYSAVEPPPYNASITSVAAEGIAMSLPNTRRNWGLLQRESDLLITQTERDVPLTYRVSGELLQHPENSVQNRPRGESYELSVRIGMAVEPETIPSNYTELSRLFATCGYSRNLNRNMNFGEETCRTVGLVSSVNTPPSSERRIDRVVPNSNITDTWAPFSIEFTVIDRCVNCVLVMLVEHTFWTSYWGSEAYIANITLERLDAQVPGRLYVNGSYERVTIPKAPVVVPSSSTSDCPHAQHGLLRWSDPSTWADGVVPQPGSSGVITIPSSQRILFDSNSAIFASATNPYGLVIVPSDSELIFEDAAITFHVEELRVFGKVTAGADTCRLTGPLEFVFHGSKPNPILPVGMGNETSKGLAVLGGGSADFYGLKVSPTWTRLATTAFAGDDWIGLQDNVSNWQIGMSVLITTAVWEDRIDLQPQNEIREIVDIDTNGMQVRLNDSLFYRHHAGPEYQVEVGVLDRSIIFRGQMNGTDMSDGYGGHSRVSGRGSHGRFSGVRAVHMGQTSVEGRYPFHFHLIDSNPDYSSMVELNGNSSAVEMIGTSWTTVTPDAQHHPLLGGSDGTFWQAQDESASVRVELPVTSPGYYNVLLSKPLSNWPFGRLEVWNGHTLSQNVSVSIQQNGIQIANLSMDFHMHDPVDVWKQWVNVTSVQLSVGSVNVTFRMQDANGRTRSLSIDAVWLQPKKSDQFVVEDSVVVDSLFRCVSIHGTNGVRLSRNIAYNIRGHCYYIEDGVEERSIIEYNLASHIHSIGEMAAGGAQVGAVFWQTDEVSQPADHAPAGFYITNARNYIYGNAASGGWTGFSFPNLPQPVGAFNTSDFNWFNPMQRKELVFDGNTAHSAGQSWVNGNCMYVGGRLQTVDGILRYHTGRNTRNTYNEYQSNSPNHFTNLKTFLCRRGINHWGNDAEIDGFEVHDVQQGMVLFGNAYVSRGLIAGQTTNPVSGIFQHLGFQFYDTWTKTMLDDVIFRGFHFVDMDLVDFPNRRSYTNRVIESMDHSDTFKPQGISAVRNIRFENVDEKTIIDMPGPDTGAGYMYNHVSFDGTLANSSTYAVVGSQTNWWQIHEGCSRHPVWGVWICTGTEENTAVASIAAIIPSITREDWEYGRIEGHRHIGYVCQRQIEEVLTSGLPSDQDLDRCMILTKNPTTTGPANTVWYWRFLGAGIASNSTKSGLLGWDAAPTQFEISYTQVSLRRFIVQAYSYPQSMTSSDFIVQFHIPYHSHSNPYVDIPQAESIESVLAGSEDLLDDATRRSLCPRGGLSVVCNVSNAGPLWFWDQPSGTLYLRVVNPKLYLNTFIDDPETADVFMRNGMWLNSIQNFVRHVVTANCTPMEGTNLCPVRRHAIPAAARPSGDSCNIAEDSLILPARLDVARSRSLAWQLTGPNYSAPLQLDVNGILSLSGAYQTLIQVPTESDLRLCNFGVGALLHTFSGQTSPYFDLILTEPGVYYFTSSEQTDCADGLQLIVEVGTDPLVDAPLLHNASMSLVQNHTTCRPVAPSMSPTALPSMSPTTLPSMSPTTLPSGPTNAAGGVELDGSDSSTMIIIVVVTTIAVVIIGLVVILLLRRKPIKHKGTVTPNLMYDSYMAKDVKHDDINAGGDRGSENPLYDSDAEP